MNSMLSFNFLFLFSFVIWTFVSAQTEGSVNASNQCFTRLLNTVRDSRCFWKFDIDNNLKKVALCAHSESLNQKRKKEKTMSFFRPLDTAAIIKFNMPKVWSWLEIYFERHNHCETWNMFLIYILCFVRYIQNIIL